MKLVKCSKSQIVAREVIFPKRFEMNCGVSLTGPCFFSSGVHTVTQGVTVRWGSLEVLLLGQVNKLLLVN